MKHENIREVPGNKREGSSAHPAGTTTAPLPQLDETNGQVNGSSALHMSSFRTSSVETGTTHARRPTHGPFLQRFWHFLAHWFVASTFAPSWLPRWLRHPIFGYLLAALLQAAAVSITLLIARIIPSFSFTDLLEVLAIALVALNWGAGPSLFATLLGAALLDYFILPPRFNWRLADPRNLVELLLFCLIGVAISIVASQVERARRHTERLAGSLTREHARLEAIIETVPDTVTIYDKHGNVVLLNEAGRQDPRPERVPGKLAEGIATHGIRTFTNEPYKVENLPVTRALQGETVSGAELRYYDASGHDRFVSASAAPLRSQQGEIEGVVSIVHDLSALHRSEREAANRAIELEAIFEAMADGIFVTGKDGHMQRMNSAFQELLGLTSQNEKNYFAQAQDEQPAYLAISDEHGQILPYEQWPESRILRGEVLKGAHAADIQLHTLDGRTLSLSVSGAPIYNRDGELVAALCICHDVTERRRLEQRTHDALNALLTMAETLVSQSEERSSTGELSSDALYKIAQRMVKLTCSVLGCTRVSISVVEPETELVRAVAVVGLTPEQEQQWWEEQRAQEIRLSDSTEPELVARLMANEVLTFDLTQPPYNERPNPYAIHSMLMAPMSVGKQLVGLLALDYGGNDHEYTQDDIALAGAVAKLTALVFERERLLRDRAEARASSLALRKANQQMEEFLGMVSHELKTPLTSIKGNTQLAVRQLRNSMQAFERILGLYEAAEQQSRRLNRLVDDLLDVSRTQAGYLEMLPGPCDLRTIVHEALEEQRKVWPERIIALDMDEETPLPLDADADRITQVVSNYLTNALKYSEADRPVHVRVSHQGDEARVAVRDEGPGLPPEEQGQIWDRFHRVPGVEVRSISHASHAGLGLGLFISKTIIEHHAGQVGVESAPGDGSTFWFTLPLSHEANTEAAPSPES